MSESVEHSERLAAGSRLGSYTIVRCIGEGGMGTVYEGRHESLGKRVAIKTLHGRGAQSGEMVSRFMREGKAAAKITHPNVVDVVDVGVQDGMPYLIMEYLEGKDLGGTLEQDAPMTPRAIADLMVPVVSALAAVHEAGIVHRDLKPDNIFITRGKGGTMEPKLVDFGISKLEDGQSLKLTGTNAILGTPYYMSPEQAASSKEIDHRSDIFSLGVILYQCATHELPFKGDSLFQLLTDIVRATPPPLRSIKADLPADFEALVTRAMQREPAQRFQSVAELGAALMPFGSQRVRFSYEHEFGNVAPSVRPPPQNVATGETLEPTTTEIHRTLHSRRVHLLIGAALIVGLLIVGLLARGGPKQNEHVVTPAPSVPELPHAAQQPLAPAPPEPPAPVPIVQAPAATAPSPMPLPPENPPIARDQPERSSPRRRQKAAQMPSVPASPQPVPVREAPVAPSEEDLFRDRK